MKKTSEITITSQPHYVLEQSDPAHRKFVWAYEITIINNTEEVVQLLGRYWQITDTSGKIEEIHGAGVVGLQPLIHPGKEFVYTSYCQLPTPQGTMEGYYEMQTIDEQHFKVEIPRFILSAPSAITMMFKSELH
jgi:ApaG protein